MVVVGVLARVETENRPALHKTLMGMQGVSSFTVADELRLGILIEAPCIDDAHAMLTNRIRPLPGVLGTWPVYLGVDDGTNTA